MDYKATDLSKDQVSRFLTKVLNDDPELNDFIPDVQSITITKTTHQIVAEIKAPRHRASLYECAEAVLNNAKKNQMTTIYIGEHNFNGYTGEHNPTYGICFAEIFGCPTMIISQRGGADMEFVNLLGEGFDWRLDRYGAEKNIRCVYEFLETYFARYHGVGNTFLREDDCPVDEMIENFPNEG
jgi:hypothetical protein